MLQRFAPIALLVFVFAAGCASETAAGSRLETTPTEQLTSSQATLKRLTDPVARAEAVLDAEFGDTSWIDSVVKIEAVDNLLQVTMDRPTATLSDLDAYARLCHALTALIASEEQPGGVAGVQFFRANGDPVVSAAAPGARCMKFYR